MSLSSAPVRATVAVADITRAKAFYEEQLGLVPLDDDAGPIQAYACGSSWLQVYESPEHAGKATATVASWSVDDHDAVVDALIARGVTFDRHDSLACDDRGVHAFGAHRVAWCSDPDGNVLAIDNGQTAGM